MRRDFWQGIGRSILAWGVGMLVWLVLLGIGVEVPLWIWFVGPFLTIIVLNEILK